MSLINQYMMLYEVLVLKFTKNTGCGMLHNIINQLKYTPLKKHLFCPALYPILRMIFCLGLTYERSSINENNR